MLSVTDSFIEYLAAGLDGIVPVHWRRTTPTDENADMLKTDALNVKSLGFFEEDSMEYCLVSLDLLGSDERTVLSQLKDIRDLLIELQVIPEYEYSDSAPPAPTGRSVSWEGRDIRFLPIRVPSGATYCHYNATFPLIHARE